MTTTDLIKSMYRGYYGQGDYEVFPSWHPSDTSFTTSILIDGAFVRLVQFKKTPIYEIHIKTRQGAKR